MVPRDGLWSRTVASAEMMAASKAQWPVRRHSPEGAHHHPGERRIERWMRSCGRMDMPASVAPGGTLDRSSALPLWAQLLADLRRRLAGGEFSDRFPTDRELVDEYGVSRQTVREAMRQLRDEGAVERQRGRGTRVRPAEFEQPFGGLGSLFRAVEATGVDQISEVRALERCREPAAAAELGLGPRAELIYLERLRLAEGVPLALDRVWLPAERASALLEADFRHTGLYDELSRRCGISIRSGRERIEPVLPGGADARLLGLRARQAAFALERITHEGSGPIEWRRALIRGDRYHLVAEWSDPSSGSAMRRPATEAAPLDP
jgi:GntR family transcriptional regulator